MKLILLSLITVSAILAHQNCKTPNQKDGKCIPFNSCLELILIYKKPNKTSSDMKYLRDSLCDSRVRTETPIMCCDVSAQCLTPDLYLGTCTEMKNCPSLKSVLRRSVNMRPKYIEDYLNESRCSTNVNDVCCSNRKPCITHIKKPHKDIEKLMPPYTECGLKTPVDRIVGGSQAAIGEFPWAALIEYNHTGVIEIGCGGTLITSRYVLTAAHCIIGNPVNIRLGEHDTENPGQDCVKLSPISTDCTEGTTTIPIEKIIPHPCYEEKIHDIALIRMQREIKQYSDFIRPVCLPNSDLTFGPKPKSTNVLTTVGWGKTEKNNFSNIKLFAALPFVDLTTCQRSYKDVKLINKQICAGGNKSVDSCKGDSGGALLYSLGDYYDLVGIVSFGPTDCGTEGVPGIYTKVLSYIDWIKGVIRP